MWAIIPTCHVSGFYTSKFQSSCLHRKHYNNSLLVSFLYLFLWYYHILLAYDNRLLMAFSHMHTNVLWSHWPLSSLVSFHCFQSPFSSKVDLLFFFFYLISWWVSWGLQEHGNLLSDCPAEEDNSYQPSCAHKSSGTGGAKEAPPPLCGRMLVVPIISRSYAGNHIGPKSSRA